METRSRFSIVIAVEDVAVPRPFHQRNPHIFSMT